MTALADWLQSLSFVDDGRPLSYDAKTDILRIKGERRCWCQLRRDTVVRRAGHQFQVLSLAKTAHLRACKPSELLYGPGQDWPRFVYWSDADVLQLVRSGAWISFMGARSLFRVDISSACR